MHINTLYGVEKLRELTFMNGTALQGNKNRLIHPYLQSFAKFLKILLFTNQIILKFCFELMDDVIFIAPNSTHSISLRNQ